MLKWLLLLLLVIGSVDSFGNTIGSDHQNFNQGMSFEDYITVHSAKTLGAGQFSLGLGVNHGVNTLPYFQDSSPENVDIEKEYNDGISAMDVNFALGVTNFLDIGLAVPYVIHQRIVEDSQYHGKFDEMGNTEIRGMIKLGLIDMDLLGLSLVGAMNYNRVENNPYTGEEDWPAYSAELVGELFLGNWSIAGNFGYRWRNSGASIAFDDDTPIEPYENQWLFSSAIEFQIPETKVSLLGEFYGNYTETDISYILSRITFTGTFDIQLEGRYRKRFW